MEDHLAFASQMDSMFADIRQIAKAAAGNDSAKQKQAEAGLKAMEKLMTGAKTDTAAGFDYVAYFRKKYEETPASVKAYEVKYKLKLVSTTGIYGGYDFLKVALHANDLSKVDNWKRD